jgi:hypothetical protein
MATPTLQPIVAGPKIPTTTSTPIEPTQPPVVTETPEVRTPTVTAIAITPNIPTQTAKPTNTVEPEVLATITLYPTATRKAVILPTPVPPGSSATPKPTQTPRPANTPTPPVNSYLKPGITAFMDKCVPINIYFKFSEMPAAQIEMCVEAIEVAELGEMRFDMSWTCTYMLKNVNGYSITFVRKDADVSNALMNVTDESGQRYHHIGTNGVAAEGFTFTEVGMRGNGSFTFPAATYGSNRFNFHDEDQRVTIADLQLPTRERTAP